MKTAFLVIAISLLGSLAMADADDVPPYAYGDGFAYGTRLSDGKGTLEKTIAEMRSNEGWDGSAVGPIYKIYDFEDGDYYEMVMESNDIVEIHPNENGLKTKVFGAANFNTNVLRQAQAVPGVRSAILPSLDPSKPSVRINVGNVVPKDLYRFLRFMIGLAGSVD